MISSASLFRWPRRRGAPVSPGVTTVRMVDAIMHGYESAFDHDFDEADEDVHQPKSVQLVMKRAVKRTWNQLAEKRIRDTHPTIPLGKKFWPLSKEERQGIERLFCDDAIQRLATIGPERDDDAGVEVIDAAFWKRGCGSLVRLRYAVLVGLTDSRHRNLLSSCGCCFGKPDCANTPNLTTRGGSTSCIHHGVPTAIDVEPV